MQKILIVLLSLVLTACATGIPEGLKPVTGIDSNRYLGTWYEIARMDHGFEAGLDSVTANYSLRTDGDIKVVNRGFDVEDQEWESVTGRAEFVGDSTIGELKVVFFGLFGGSYNIIELDKKNYDYVIVCGSSRNVMWILARTPVMDKKVQAMLVEKTKSMGFAVGQLIWVDQSRNIN